MRLCHLFHFLDENEEEDEEEEVGVIWSHNLLEIYQSEINFISSHTESASQLNLCPATFGVPSDPRRRAEGGMNSRAIKL